MRVLLAIDGSPFSEAAVHHVGRHVWSAETEVCIVTVDARLGDSSLGESGDGVSAYDEIVTRERADANEALERSAELLTRAVPTLSVSTALLEGTPKEELLRFAKQWDADLIVVGSHGHGAVRSLLLGSVSAAIAFNSPCSVLIVRHDDHDDTAESA